MLGYRLDPAALGGGEEGADEDDDAVPDLVENFEAVSTEVSDSLDSLFVMCLA